MKALTLFILALIPLTTLCDFVPVSNYNIQELFGKWWVNSIYDTMDTDYSYAYCMEFEFQQINDTAISYTLTSYDGYSGQFDNNSYILFPDPNNSAILYQDADRKQAPLLILNVSTYPYWVQNNYTATIIGANYTRPDQIPQLAVIGLSRWYDTSYDIRPFIEANNLPPVSNTNNFWLHDSACDTHYGWVPLPLYNTALLKNTWNLIAVYDPANTDIVPWYTGGGIYDWNQAYCASVSYTDRKAAKNELLMKLSLKSLYQGTFERSWELVYPDKSSVLLGFNINESTLLYVQYADLLGNLILTTGTTTSFFLSTKATTLTPVELTLFETTLKAIDWKIDNDYIYPIDNSSC